MDKIDSGSLTELSRNYIGVNIGIEGQSTVAISSALKLIKEHLNFSELEGQCISLV